MIIDSHVHISIYNDNAKNLEEAFELLLTDMKKQGIDYAIVIPDNIEDSDTIADLNKARQITQNSKKFFLLGSPQIIQRGSKEIDRYNKLLKEKVIVGLKFFPGHDPYYPNDERCWAYYEMCQKLNVPVLFHTGENSNDSECAKFNDPKYIALIAKKYPQLKIIITHYYWPKLDYCYEITKNIDNIYFELAAMADEEVIEKSGGIEKVKEVLIKTINDRPDKVIYGTDWPMCRMKDHINLVKSLNFDKEIENKIFYYNAVGLYKLPLQSRDMHYVKRIRAIIIKDKKVLTIKRTKINESYWVLPGGGVEDGETAKQTLIREGKEELGLDLKVGELITIIKSGKEKTIGQDEFFYRCEIVGGELGKGNGPEFQKNSDYKGSYCFEWISLSKLDKYDLRPEEIKKFIQEV